MGGMSEMEEQLNEEFYINLARNKAIILDFLHDYIKKLSLM